MPHGFGTWHVALLWNAALQPSAQVPFHAFVNNAPLPII
jgi:hypothetical protein